MYKDQYFFSNFRLMQVCYYTDNMSISGCMLLSILVYLYPLFLYFYVFICMYFSSKVVYVNINQQSPGPIYKNQQPKKNLVNDQVVHITNRRIQTCNWFKFHNDDVVIHVSGMRCLVLLSKYYQCHYYVICIWFFEQRL